jgi:hypothetical protein
VILQIGERLQAMNVELAQKALDSIRQFPENHDQGSWISGPTLDVNDDREIGCGTSMCFAGWVAFHAAPVGSQLIDGIGVRFPNGETDRISTYARESLDIGYEQAGAFFYGAGSLEELELLTTYLADNPDASASVLYEDVLEREYED